MELVDRIDRLEKLYEKQHHTLELLSIYVPKLCDWIIKYYNGNEKFAHNVIRDLKMIRDFTKLTDKDLQEHFKEHGDKPISKRKYNKYI